MSNTESSRKPQALSWANVASLPSQPKNLRISMRRQGPSSSSTFSDSWSISTPATRVNSPTPEDTAPLSKHLTSVNLSTSKIPRSDIEISSPDDTATKENITIDNSQSTSILSTVIPETQNSEDNTEQSPETITAIESESESESITPEVDDSAPHDPYMFFSDSRRRAYQQLDEFKRVRQDSTTRYMSLDVEKHIYGAKPITEVGATTWNGGPLAGTDFQDAKFFHYKSREHLGKHNKKPLRGMNFNHKDDFFGTSVVDRLPNIAARLMSKINGMKKLGQVVIVVHAGTGDLSDLKSIGCDFSGVVVLDTQLLNRAICRDDSQIGLQNLVYSYGHPVYSDTPFHNAGNDAYYTMWALAKMGQTLDDSAEEAST